MSIEEVRFEGEYSAGLPVTMGGADSLVADWVAMKLGFPLGAFNPCTTLAVLIDGEVTAGVVYHGYYPYKDGGGRLEGGIASNDPRWCNRTVLRDIFRYPFVQLGVSRFSVTCAKSNKKARRFVQRLGFKMEGVGRRLWSADQDAVVYSMLPSECRWIGGPHG